jgi:hypothetical protein
VKQRVTFQITHHFLLKANQFQCPTIIIGFCKINIASFSAFFLKAYMQAHSTMDLPYPPQPIHHSQDKFPKLKTELETSAF